MNNDKKILALFGLKWNPFLPNIPVAALWQPPGFDSFLYRLENMILDGGFALIHGEPGLGKSKTLQIIAHRFKQMSELRVGVMERPQSSASDFYREMGELFGVNLPPANRRLKGLSEVLVLPDNPLRAMKSTSASQFWSSGYSAAVMVPSNWPEYAWKYRLGFHI